MAAKNRLEQMKSEDQLEQNKKEITSAAAKRKAQKVSSCPFFPLPFLNDNKKKRW